MTYWLSVIRFVPNPVTGEFVNVAAIAGSDDSEEWDLRTVQHWGRAKRMDERGTLSAVMKFIDTLQTRIERSESGFTEVPSEAWLHRLSHEMQNIAQVSAPIPVAVEDAASALDLAFSNLVIDPTAASRHVGKNKGSAVAALRQAFKARDINAYRHGSLRSGPSRTDFDFVVANGKAVQLVRCWSFQLHDQVDLAEKVKAWAWGVRAFRIAGKGDAVVQDHPTLAVDKDVDVEAVFLPPLEDQQSKMAYEVAMAAFQDRDTEISAVPIEKADSVAKHALELIHPFRA